MTGILVYLLIGIAFGFVIEVAWPKLSDEGEELTLTDRAIAVALWPLVIILGILKYFADDEDLGGPTNAGAH